MSQYVIERYIGASWRAHIPVEIKADSVDEALLKYCQEYLIGSRRLAYESVEMRVLLGDEVWRGYPEETGYLLPLGEDGVATELAVAQLRKGIRRYEHGANERPD